MRLLTIPFLAMMALACAKEQPAKTPLPLQNKVDSEGVKRDEIVAFARQYMGAAYCYASSDPKKGFDCSGFVYFVFKHFGIEVPRSSSGFMNAGKEVKPEDFKVGDVLVFSGYRDRNTVGHVGIICEANGMKSKFIHASSGKEMAVTISELGSDQYTRRFIKCVNVL